MRNLDGQSKELYPGEVEYFHTKIKRQPERRSDFDIVRQRVVERLSSGYKIVYKNQGVFRDL